MTTSVSGNNLILKVGSGQIKVNNAKSQKVSVVGANNKTTIIGGSSNSTLMTVTNSNKSPLTLSAGIVTADASTRTKAIYLTGNAKNNSIKGGSGDDTLVGGKGNDTLTGGKGKNVYIYKTGDGKDVITDYKVTDKIQISGNYSTSTSGQDKIIKVGTGSITLKNAKNTKLNITKLKSFEERWFMDNNFISSDVDSILNKENSIDTNNFDVRDDLNYLNPFNKKSSLLTSAKK